MSSLYRVVGAHSPDGLEPLTLNRGDTLRFERRQTNWDGWLWCSKPGGQQGWVPEAWVKVQGDACVVKCDYNASELTAHPGELLEGILTESGWLLAVSSGTRGWIPLKCVESVEPAGMKPVFKRGLDSKNGLVVLQVFIGLGAVAGGFVLILEPSGASIGIPLELLKDSPFSTYLVPGIVLLAVNGMGSLVGAVASFTRHRFSGELAIALGSFLFVWILLQVYLFAGFHWVHALYLGLGLLESALGWTVRKVLRREVAA